ncbi:hypothetical protein NEOLEDRAFT_948060 [Neolentinus lepideus HHB14362 ss-1]|uniref:Protein kinase domain-containing protein n=1 Tax=Neolentinus lepideus HHB14362 ss-1 TaxID=1314782 RepID=A0A165UD22_9AGAM|nr:hypothetical protein NEOLEDRAFT_948060 [Neolentinus lepideus HHB14362 ss-1]
MQTLLISFPDGTGCGKSKLQLTRTGCSADAKLHDIRVQEEIYNTEHSIIYRAIETTPKRSVALKFARTPTALVDLCSEEKVYTHKLFDLQGTVVPHCFGFYEELSGGETVGCLVLEDRGEPVPERLEVPPIDVS